MKDSTQGAFNSLTFYFDGPVESMFSFGGFSRFRPLMVLTISMLRYLGV